MSVRDETFLDELALLVDGDREAHARWEDTLADDPAASDLLFDADGVAKSVAEAGADFVPMPDPLAGLGAELDAIDAERAEDDVAPRATLPDGGVAPSDATLPDAGSAADADSDAGSDAGSDSAAESSTPEAPVPVATVLPRRRRAPLLIGGSLLFAAAAAAAYTFLPSTEPAEPPTGPSGVPTLALGGARVATLAGTEAGGLTLASGGALAESAAVDPGDTVVTDTRTRALLQLADGSSVTLNQASRLRFDEAARAVHLLAGEALFDVSHLAASENFVVHVPAGRVTVLGTKFLVTVVDDERAAVEVLRGRVRLETSAGSVDLKRGEEGFLRAGEVPRALPAPDLGEGLVWSEIGPQLDDDVPVPGLGELRAHRPGESEESERELVLAQHDVQVRVSGSVARTEIEETFRNDEDHTLEGVYRFPLPPGARIAKLSLEVDGEWIDGAIVPKDRGRAIWRGVIRNATPNRPRPDQEEWVWVPGPWRDPALLEWQRGGRVELRIFPIPAHGVRRVRVAYEEHIQPHGAGRRYVYPLPQAGDGSTQVGSFSFDMRVRGAAQVDTRGADLRVAAEGEVATVRTHREAFTPAGDIVVDLAERGAQRELRWFPYAGAVAVPPTRDRAARGEDEERSARARAIQSELASDTRPHVVFALRPELPRVAEVRPADVVLVVDSSQSMVGERYARAIRLVERTVRELDRRDRVMLVACDVACRNLSDGPQEGGDASAVILAARLREYEPAGASNLAFGLAEAVRIARSAGNERELHLVYIGDGAASVGPRGPAALRVEVEELVRQDAIRAQAGFTLTTVGIGQDADDANLRAIARAGGGVYLGFTPGQRVAETSYAVLAALYGTTLRDATLELPPGLEAPAPATLPNLRAGEELLVAARMSSAQVSGEVTLRGKVGGVSFERSYPIRVEPTTAGGNAFVPRVWAAERIAELERGGTLTHGERAGAAERKAEIVALSRGYGVLSRETSLLVLESDAMFDAFGIDRSRPTVDWTGEEELVAGGAGEVMERSIDPQGAGLLGTLGARGTGAGGSGIGRSLSGASASTRARRSASPAPSSVSSSVPSRQAARPSLAEEAEASADLDDAANITREGPKPPTRRVRAPQVRGEWRRRVRVRVGEVRADTEVRARDLSEVEAARAALGENPDSRDRHRALVRALSRAGQLAEAEAAARAWLARDRMDAEALTYLADVIGRQGQRERALRVLSGVVDLEPDRVVLHERLAKAFERGAEPRRACDHRVALADIQGEFEAQAASRGRASSASSAGAEAVARAVRCERALGRAAAAERLLAARTTGQRAAIEGVLGRGGDTERVRGELLVDAQWSVPVDLDLSLVTPQGTRISWFGGRTSVVGDQGQASGRERLGLRRVTPGTYYLEIARTDRGPHATDRPRRRGSDAFGSTRAPTATGPISGTLRVNVLGESRTLPFTLVGERVQVGAVQVRSEWRTETRTGARPLR